MKAITAGGNWSLRCKDRGHPTFEQLIGSATVLLDEYLPTEITAEMVLKKSGVSKGSLYHHFDDLSHLLETALIRSFSASVDENVSYMRNLLLNARSASDYHQAILDFNDYAQSADRRNSRLSRVRLLGNALSNPRLAARLAIEQSRLTQAYAELFHAAQARGWLRPDFDAHAAAVFVQAFTIGRIVDDISEKSMDLEAWKELLLNMAGSVFGVKASA